MSLIEIFDAVRPMFACHEGLGVVLHDDPGRYYLGTHEVRAKDGYRTWFGGVEIKKAYVSVHLIPVYTHPSLLEGTSDALRQRMQGKSCFNLKKHDAVQLAELATLINRGVERGIADGLLQHLGESVSPPGSGSA